MFAVGVNWIRAWLVWFVKPDKQAGGVHLRCSQHCDPEKVSWPLYAPCYFDCLVYCPANSQTSSMSTLQISSQHHAYSHRKSTQRDTLRNFSNLNVPSRSQDKNYSHIFVIFFWVFTGGWQKWRICTCQECYQERYSWHILNNSCFSAARVD